jgi:hypothetical protein
LRFNKTRPLCGIDQCLTDLVDRGVQVVIDIDERVRPKPPLQFLSADHFTRPLQQNGQNGKWLTGQFQLSPPLPQLSRSKINF